VQVAFHQTFIGTMSPAELWQTPDPGHRERSSGVESYGSFAAAVPPPQHPPDPRAARGRTANRGRCQRQALQDRTLPPQHVLDMAWQEMREAAEACVPTDSNSNVEPQHMAMQHCDDTACWQAGAGGEAADEPKSDACAAAESWDVAAGYQRGDSCSACASAGTDHVTEDDEWHCQEDQLVHHEADSITGPMHLCIVYGQFNIRLTSMLFLLLVAYLIVGFRLIREVRGYADHVISSSVPSGHCSLYTLLAHDACLDERRSCGDV
jgi:hypothetical protein